MLSLTISSRLDSHKHRDKAISDALSLLDPDKGYGGITLPRRVRRTELLVFHDLDHIESQHPRYKGCTPPTKAHVESVLSFFAQWRAAPGALGVVVHCEAGVSRSTAASIIGLCSLGLSAEAAFNEVENINPVALPNRRMLRLAGKMFGDKGALAELADARRAELFEKYDQPDPVEKLKAEIPRSLISFKF